MNPSNSTERTVGFVQQSGERDTLSLLFSCLLTLALCVYTAVHLNVPPKGEKYWKTLCRELKWCVIGLFGPEYVVFAAWRQWSSAFELQKSVNEILEQPSCDATVVAKEGCTAAKTVRPVSTSPSAWSIVHGFYGSMGGFVVEKDAVPLSLADEIFGDSPRLSLTARGAQLVYKCEGLPYVTIEDIKDKNKADTVAKLFVCIQAGWFTAQVFARLAVGLPITLLEINTLGHVAIALVMYALWWHKPRQVREPTKLDADRLAPLLALMFMMSKISGHKHFKMPFHKCAKDAEAGLVQFRCAGVSRRNSQDGSTSQLDGIQLQTGRFEWVEEKDFIPSGTETAQSRERWKLASEAISCYSEVKKKLLCPQHGIYEDEQCGSCNTFRLPMEELLVVTTTDWPTEELLRTVNSLTMGVILWGATIIYGAIHTAAWNAYFPTLIETWMWHSSSIWVAFSGAVWVFINAVAKAWKSIDNLWIRFLKRETHWVFNTLILFLCSMCGMAYIFSRAFLVVEAFISLRKLPASAYQTPSWLQVLPHL